MDLATVADELYGLPLKEFTPVRDAQASEARKAGDRALASSLKSLRKPSVAAWMANMLVRQRGADIERLIGQGESLRSARTLKRELIRTASKEKVDSVAKLIRHAKVMADRAEQPVSRGALEDLEGTLDAAFADPESATALREGCLTVALRYSGLGFEGGAQGARNRISGSARDDASSPSGAGAADKARRALKEANREAEHADADLNTARRAVVAAESELKRLRAALTVAERQATKARQKALAAQKKVVTVRDLAER